MIIYYIVFFLGLLPGFLFNKPSWVKFSNRIIIASGNMLIALFGMQIAGAEEVRKALIFDILSSVYIALASVIGSVVFTFVFLLSVMKIFKCYGTEIETVSGVNEIGIKNIWLPTIISVCLLILGMCIGIQFQYQGLTCLIKSLLLVMISSVGMHCGCEIELIRHRKNNRRIPRYSFILFMGLPMAIIAGTLLFSAFMGLFLEFKWSECMLCASPMGWQTLGGPMVMELRGPRLGNIAFLVNMSRDVIALIIIPLISHGKFKVLSVSPGGVSTMDILLPVVIASSGRCNLGYAMWVGACCSFWAPIMIYLIGNIFA